MVTAIFDLDGTIADTIQDLADAVNYGLREMGLPEHSIASYKKFVGNGAEKLCYRALPDDRKDEADKLHALFREYYNGHFLDNTTLYPGIKETIEILAQHDVTLAVATNKPQDFAREIVRKLLPEVNFIKVLGGCAERPKKPDTAIINEILSPLPSDNTVFMIGDSNVDIKTAKNADIISIGCTWGFRDRKELTDEGADYIADTADDIIRIISGKII
ncbi:MAG: HAD-IA family hydrolase [Ruminococcus flavefaciens]|nr:HAD-IA family hydrolase [Ruminococcus flavefaciens]MCM1229923.1 HAD-IA family hydrolase [Ruminococcus flavefaciens]